MNNWIVTEYAIINIKDIENIELVYPYFIKEYKVIAKIRNKQLVDDSSIVIFRSADEKIAKDFMMNFGEKFIECSKEKSCQNEC